VPWVIATMVLHCSSSLGWAVMRRLHRYPFSLTSTAWFLTTPSTVGLVPLLGRYLGRTSRRGSTS
jgi:hypothetical protein